MNVQVYRYVSCDLTILIADLILQALGLGDDLKFVDHLLYLKAIIWPVACNMISYVLILPET